MRTIMSLIWNSGRRLLVTALSVALLMGFTAGPAKAQVGWHQPAPVTCYDSLNQGRIQVEPRYDKVGAGRQWLAHKYWFQNIATRQWVSTPWSSHDIPSGHAFYYAAIIQAWAVPKGSYYVWTQYGWNLLNGAGWHYAWDFSSFYSVYLYDSQERYCRTIPLLVVVR